MRMTLIEPVFPLFYFKCADCGTERDSRDGWADLDGEPFRAYYCHGCAGKRAALPASPPVRA